MLLPLLLASSLASSVAQLPDDVPSPPPCTCLGVVEHDYDFIETQSKTGNLKAYGRRWTCRFDCKLDKLKWADALKGKGWEIIKASDQIVMAQKGQDRFLKCVSDLTVLQRGEPPPFELPPPPETSEELTADVERPWLGPVPGAIPDKRELVMTPLDVTNPKTGSTFLKPPYVRLSYQLPRTLAEVGIRNMFQRALAKVGWDVLTPGNDGGILIAHYARSGRDLWVKVSAVTGYKVEMADVSAQEAWAKLQQALDKDGHVAVYGLYFDTGSPKLKPESEPVLQQLRALLEKSPSLKLEIQGHTDNTGKSDANQTLSEARAQSVVAWLVQHGVAQARLTARGYADQRPVADNKTPEGRALNRRVELSRSP
ncbi:MAG: OmpA family protein [Deltaproteobacteria bacterium]|nr:OmpA family protein [Deltaproteobacteria bacterium]